MSAESSNNIVLEFRHVSCRTEEGRTLLSDINLEVRRGETLVLLGRSGSGKTDRKSTRLNSSHIQKSRMPSSA